MHLKEKTITFRIPEYISDALDKESKASGITKTSIVVRAIEVEITRSRGARGFLMRTSDSEEISKEIAAVPKKVTRRQEKKNMRDGRRAIENRAWLFAKRKRELRAKCNCDGVGGLDVVVETCPLHKSAAVGELPERKR